MSKSKWIGIIIFCLIINLASSHWIFHSFWAFVVFAALELAIYIYYQYREQIYEEGLIAISPDKLFKNHEEQFYKQTQVEIDNRTNKNSNDLNVYLEALDKDFTLEKEKYFNIVEEIETALAQSDVDIDQGINEKVQKWILDLNEKENYLNQLIKEIEQVLEQIHKSEVIDPKLESKRIDRVVEKLKHELGMPQLHLERRIYYDLELVHQRIKKFKQDLDKRLNLRHKKLDPTHPLDDY